MKVIIEIVLDSDALQYVGELSRILTTVEGKVTVQRGRSSTCLCDAPEVSDKLLDTNGNTVGSVRLVC
jgi:hypothetical protein